MTDNVDQFIADAATEPNPDAAYHAHDAFNQSTANKLLNQSPRHAFEYRRLQKLYRGKPDPNHTREREIGTVTHKLLLGSHTGYVEIQADDYRTKQAQETRSTCEVNGVTPILSGDLEKATRAANALREQLAEEFGITLDGQSEVALLWEETVHGGVGPDHRLPCKAKLDHIMADGLTILDVKSGEEANPKNLVRRILQQGYHVQAACYSRGLAANFPELEGRVRFLDIFIETGGLSLCTPTEISGGLLELGEREWLRACRAWAECQGAGRYPGYITEVWRPECPEWALKAEMGQ